MYIVVDKYDEIPESYHSTIQEARSVLTEQTSKGYSVYMIIERPYKYESRLIDTINN